MSALLTLFSLKGRINRMAFLSSYILFIIFIIVVGAILLNLFGHAVGGTLFIILAIYPQFALAVKRWHDMDMRGWWFLGSFVPVLNVLCAFRLFFKKGTEGTNRFGDDPLLGISVQSFQLNK